MWRSGLQKTKILKIRSELENQIRIKLELGARGEQRHKNESVEIHY